MDRIISYTKTAKFLHWLMALIWILVWTMGMLAVYGRQTFNPEHGLTAFHKAIASTILLLVVIRIIWRLTHTPPALPANMSNHAQYITKLGHIAIYLFALIAMPLSGWLLCSFANSPIMVVGLFNLPPLTTPHPEYVDLIWQIHCYLAWFCGLLILGHILLAFKHHFIDKDTVLISMLPLHKKL